MNRLLRGVGRIAGLLAFEISAIVILHRIDGTIDFANFSSWLNNTTTLDAIAALIRMGGLALAYYLLASTTFYLVARATRIPGAIQAAEWLTLPLVRQVVDKAIVVTIVTSSTVGMSARVAVAQTDSPSSGPAVISVVGEDSVGTPIPQVTNPTASQAEEPEGPPFNNFPVVEETTTTVPTPTTTIPSAEDLFPSSDETSVPTPTTIPGTPTTTTPPIVVAPEPEPPTEAPPQVQGETVHLVERGDNLWKIAAEQLAAVRGTDADSLSNSEIRDYWLQVIEANRGSIRSGDPNVIYAGEAITLPPV